MHEFGLIGVRASLGEGPREVGWLALLPIEMEGTDQGLGLLGAGASGGWPGAPHPLGWLAG